MEAPHSQPSPSGFSSYPLAVFLGAIGVGVCLDRWLGVGVPEFLLPVSGVCLLLWAFTFSNHGSRWFGLLLLLVSVLAASCAWHHCFWRLVPADHIALQVVNRGPQPVVLRVRVTSVPEYGPLPVLEPLATIPQGVRSRFRARVTAIRDGHDWIDSSGRLDIRAEGHLLGLRAGDALELCGTLLTPTGPMNPGQRDFRLAGRTERVFCRLDVRYPACVKVLEEAGATAGSVVSDLRVAGLQLLDKFVSVERGDLAGALLLGARDRVDDARVERFFHTGTIHLLAISGLHVGILAWAFFAFARGRRSREPILIGLMLLTILYCMITGSRPPVLRATVLIIVVCAGLILRRRVLAWNALAAAAIVLLIIRPAALFSTGAQLSFVAVATLIWIGLNVSTVASRPVDRLISEARPWHEQFAYSVWLRAQQLTLVSFAIWFVTLPLVMHRFHLVSPIGLALNVVLMVPVTIGLLTGFLVLLSGNVWAPLARVVGACCDRCLWFFESTVSSAHDVPYAWFWVAGPGAVWCGVFYVVLAVVVGVPGCRPNRLWAAVLVLLWFSVPAAGGLIRELSPADDALRCTFLCVGHGTCAVLELPDERVLLYDCGRMGFPRTGVDIVSQYLWHRGISHLDGVVISHADADHYNALPGLVERFSVGEVLVSPFMFDSEAPGVIVLKQRLQSANVPCRHLRTHDVMRLGEVTMSVLHPSENRMTGSDNANSILLEVEYQGRKILLPGDLEPPGLGVVVAEAARDVDVVMAPHHGSLRSLPERFLQWCSPEWVVVSADEDHFSAPAQAMFRTTGANVLHTAKVGAVTVSIRQGDLSVDTFLPLPLAQDAELAASELTPSGE